MDTLEKAKQLYKDTNNTEVKNTLIELYGEESFKDKIQDRIKTIQDVFDTLNIDRKSFNQIHKDVDEHTYNYVLLTLITKALNEGWTPDWSNSNEYKYYPWFKMASSFEFGNYNFWDTNSIVGSRLSFKSEELAEYAATQFKDVYKKFMLI